VYVDSAAADLAALRTAFDTNVIAVLRLTSLFTAALAAHRGSVVMMNSAVLRHSRLPYGGYKMTKSALCSCRSSRS
jgi:NAD(P)-dependent dehydrogenase (short-subunit alcohol dehydrogenase family)